MKEYNIFDILGPIMIGPSSSHTAGAARLGKMARTILDNNFNKVTFYLHGSFAKTASGHGTDRALLAGVLNMNPDDERLINSFNIADKNDLDYTFIESDLGDVHPNTVKIEFNLDNGEVYYIIGSSIGGGNISIKNINGTNVNFTGNQPTILIKNKDNAGVIAHISSLLSEAKVNIATMNVTRDKGIATMIIEVDSIINDNLIENISKSKDIIYIKAINPNKE